MEPYQDATPRIRFTAHRALSASTSSSPLAQTSNCARYRGSPLFPIAIATFRCTLFFRVRSKGEPLNHRLNAAESISASHSSEGFTNPSRISIPAFTATGALRFHGHTS